MYTEPCAISRAVDWRAEPGFVQPHWSCNACNACTRGGVRDETSLGEGEDAASRAQAAPWLYAPVHSTRLCKQRRREYKPQPLADVSFCPSSRRCLPFIQYVLLMTVHGQKLAQAHRRPLDTATRDLPVSLVQPFPHAPNRSSQTRAAGRHRGIR